MRSVVAAPTMAMRPASRGLCDRDWPEQIALALAEVKRKERGSLH